MKRYSVLGLLFLPLLAFSNVTINFNYYKIPTSVGATALKTQLVSTDNTVCLPVATTNSHSTLSLDMKGGLCWLSGTVGFEACFKVTTATGDQYFVTKYTDASKDQSFTLTPGVDSDGKLYFTGDLTVESKSSCPDWQHGVPLG